jgi:hypothetical protein
MLQGATALQGATPSYAALQAFGQVLFEVNPYGLQSQITNPDYWFQSTQQDDFQTDADGTIWLRGLRGLPTPQSFGVSFSGTAPNIVITAWPAAIRMTCAIPCDHRVTGGYKISSDPTPGLQVYEFTSGSSDANRIDPSLSRLHFVDARQLYSRWQRYNSFPQPQSAGGTQAANQILRDDSGYLTTAVQRKLEDIGRVGKNNNPRIPYLNFAFEPGMAFESMGQWNMAAMLKEVSWVAPDEGPQFTELGTE